MLCPQAGCKLKLVKFILVIYVCRINVFVIYEVVAKHRVNLVYTVYQRAVNKIVIAFYIC